MRRPNPATRGGRNAGGECAERRAEGRVGATPRRGFSDAVGRAGRVAIRGDDEETHEVLLRAVRDERRPAQRDGIPVVRANELLRRRVLPQVVQHRVRACGGSDRRDVIVMAW